MCSSVTEKSEKRANRIPRLFLSHSSRDKSLAERIALDLRSSGITVWYDEWEIRVGDSISQKIEQGLDNADFVAVLLTSHSVASGWVEKEWQSKIGEEAREKQAVVLPLKGEDCRIPPLLRDKRYADFAASYQDALDELVFAVSGSQKVSLGSNDRAGTQADSSTKPSDPDGANALTVGQLADLIAGPDADSTIETRKGLEYQALAVAYQATPITGDEDSTQQIVMPEVVLVVLQGSGGAVKLERLPVPNGARELRAKCDTGTGDGLVRSWLFVMDDYGVREVHRSALSGESRWVLAPGDAGAYLYIVGLYPGMCLFKESGDAVVVEVTDLAGHVDSFYVAAGGQLQRIVALDVFRFLPGTKLRFAPLAPDMCLDLESPTVLIQNRFLELIEYLRSSPTSRYRDVLDVWDEAQASDTFAGVKVRDVKYNMIVRLAGARI